MATPRPRRTVLAAALLTLMALTALPAAAQESTNDSDGDGLRDRFEERWGVSDPSLADTDRDGLIDAAEDHDGDRLSALGEQRYGTDPGNPDSDGDGTPDGDEDRDADGVPDAREQDQRRMPRGLRPDPAAAYWDRPANYDDECHSDQFDLELHTCEFGDLRSDRIVVLFGDSHALQWLPALTGPAKRQGWRVVTLTKAACPPARILSGRKEPIAGTSCERWREKALRWIEVNEPQVALLAAGSRIYKLVDGRGERIPDEDRTARWQRGLARVLAEIPDATQAVVLADTPYLGINPATCLTEDPSDLSACSTSRTASIDSAFDAAERATTETAGATYADLTSVVCPYSPCPVVIGDVLVYRNRDHITATYAQQLAPSMRSVVEAALSAAEPGGAAPAANWSPETFVSPESSTQPGARMSPEPGASPLEPDEPAGD
jgi:hypothetical protein